MKYIKALVIGAFILSSASCSDFENSKPKPTAGGTQGGFSKPTVNPFQGTEADPTTAPFTEEKMLVNIGLNIIAPQAKRFRLQTEVLEMRVKDYCEALETNEDVEVSLKLAREQWAEAMLDYNRLEGAPVGPLGDKTLGLASEIYAYPYAGICPLDIHVAGGRPTTLEGLPFSVKGLTALEYLLYDSPRLFDGHAEPKLGSQCFRATTTLKTWIEKPELEKQKDRCAWSQTLAADLVQKAQLLEAYWDPAQGNYTKALIDGSVFTGPKAHSLRRATNSVTDALFSVERLKDQRLGRPLGLHKDCPADKLSCPEQVEHPFSGLAFRAQAETLKFFKKVFFGTVTGAVSYGIDDLLSENDSDIAPEIEHAIEKSLESNQSLREKGTFLEQLANFDSSACERTTVTNRIEELCAYHQDVRQIATILKIEILTAFSPPLDAPAGLEGDGD